MSNRDKNKKIAAVAAGALVVGLGLTYTLATWTDSEWVWGGSNNDPGVGSSSFNVQQDTTNPYGAGSFGDFETNPGDELTFSAGALALTPGDSIYAPVALRTEETSVGGEITLQAAVPATGITVDDDGDLLWEEMRVTVYTAAGDPPDQAPPAACAPGLDTESWTEILTNAPLGTAATLRQGLVEEAGSVQHYCFVLTLPEDAQEGTADTLMGRTIAPAWEFEAESTS